MKNEPRKFYMVMFSIFFILLVLTIIISSYHYANVSFIGAFMNSLKIVFSDPFSAYTILDLLGILIFLTVWIIIDGKQRGIKITRYIFVLWLLGGSLGLFYYLLRRPQLNSSSQLVLI